MCSCPFLHLVPMGNVVVEIPIMVGSAKTKRVNCTTRDANPHPGFVKRTINTVNIK